MRRSPRRSAATTTTRPARPDGRSASAGGAATASSSIESANTASHRRPTAEAVQGRDGVAQVQQQRPEEDEVERAVLVGIEVVDGAVDPSDRGAQGLLRQREAGGVLLERVEVLRPPSSSRPKRSRARVASPSGGIVDVDGGDGGRAAALHLEGPEAVPGPDVKAAKAVEAGGQRDVRDGRPRVEVTRASQRPGRDRACGTSSARRRGRRETFGGGCGRHVPSGLQDVCAKARRPAHAVTSTVTIATMTRIAETPMDARAAPSELGKSGFDIPSAESSTAKPASTLPAM